eukprot:3576278-Rhodomonas_salina.2
MPGTGLAHSSLAMPGTGLAHSSLRVCYGVPGTDLAYGATRPAFLQPRTAHLLSWKVLVPRPLRAPYAMSGTRIPYRSQPHATAGADLACGAAGLREC